VGDLPEAPKRRRNFQIKLYVWSCCLPYQPSQVIDETISRTSLLLQELGGNFTCPWENREIKTVKLPLPSAGHRGQFSQAPLLDHLWCLLLTWPWKWLFSAASTFKPVFLGRKERKNRKGDTGEKTNQQQLLPI